MTDLLAGPSTPAPPHDEDAERAVIGAALLDTRTAAALVDELRVADFYLPAHAAAWTAITALVTAGAPVELTSVSTHLRSLNDPVVPDPAYLHECTLLTTPSSGAYYAGKVRDAAVSRRAAVHGQALTRAALSGAEPTALQDLLDRASTDLVAHGGMGGLRAAADIVWPVLQQIEDGPSKSVTPTGYKDLDRLLIGGLRPGTLTIIAARPAVGKSVMGADIARHIARVMRLPSLIYSLEMSEEELMQRILAAEARVDLTSIRAGTGLEDRDWHRLGTACSELTAAPLFIDDSPGMTVQDIRASARRAAQRFGRLGVVVVDYLQLLSSSRRGENRQVEVAEMSKALKRTAKELECPVVALCQLNREPDKRPDKRPIISDLRESGSIEADADNVVLLHRPEIHDPDDNPGVLEAQVAKHRAGQTGLVKLTARLATSTFVDMAYTLGPAIV